MEETESQQLLQSANEHCASILMILKYLNKEKELKNAQELINNSEKLKILLVKEQTLNSEIIVDELPIS